MADALVARVATFHPDWQIGARGVPGSDSVGWSPMAAGLYRTCIEQVRVYVPLTQMIEAAGFSGLRFEFYGSRATRDYAEETIAVQLIGSITSRSRAISECIGDVLTRGLESRFPSSNPDYKAALYLLIIYLSGDEPQYVRNIHCGRLLPR